MKKCIIYVLGAGRSGTTLLDIILGNGNQIKSCGELLRFAETKGEPPGYDRTSVNYQYWGKVKKSLEEKYKNELNYVSLFDDCKKIEFHKSFLSNYLNVTSAEVLNRYCEYNNNLYSAIFETIDEPIIVDSSKWPGRLLALYKCIKEYDIKVVYLVRNPASVVKSFSIKDIEQPYKGVISANIYYFIVNLACNFVMHRMKNVQKVKIRYEDLLHDPIGQLRRIEKMLDIDLSNSINIIENNNELLVDNLFEGNRIRKNKSILLKRINEMPRIGVKGYISMAFNGIWWIKR